MKKVFSMIFNEFLSNFDLNEEQYEEIFGLYEQLDENQIEEVEDYIEFSNSLDNYDYDEFKDIIKEALDITDEEDFEEEIEEINDEDFEEEIEEINDEEDFEEEIEEINDEDFEEEIEEINDEDFEEEVEEINDEDFEEEVEEIDEEEVEEKIEEKKEEPKDYIPKRVYTDGYVESEPDIPTKLVIPKTDYINVNSKIKPNKFDSIKTRTFKILSKVSAFMGNKFTKKEVEPEVDYMTKNDNNIIKTDVSFKNDNKLEEFIKCNNIDNEEINDYIRLINFRDDKNQIREELSKFIENNEKVINEDVLLKKLHSTFGINEENTKIDNKIVKEETKKEEKEIKEEKNITIKQVKEEKEEKQNIPTIVFNEKYETLNKELFNDLNNYEKAFVEDMKSEGLNPGDIELDQMFNQRCVNKTTIYKYLLKVEKIKLLNAYENLSEFERIFVDDATAENINYKDAEYYQMLNERCVNKNMINNYYSILEKSYEYQKLITDDYMKHVNYEASINLEDKKVNDLKQIAKDRNLTNISKLNKKQLIEALNELTNMKLEQTQKELSL